MDDPCVQAAISGLKSSVGGSGDDDNCDAKRLCHVKDNHLFVWSRRESNLLAVCLNKDLGGGGNGTRTQTFDLTDTPVFEIDHLLSSPTGRWICLYGSRGVSCVELPRRSGKFGRFGGGAERVTVRSFSLAERFFLCQTRLFVNQVQFHPGSSLDGHLVVLASDNYLRIYNVDQDRSTPEQNICLSGRSNNKTDNKSTSNLFAESGLSVKGSLGEIAVGFSFAPPVEDSSVNDVGSDSLISALSSTTAGKSGADNLWPMFILHGNGSVFCLSTGLGSHKPEGGSRMLGPLAMFPEASDNYGTDSCSVLCLHPLISSPPILVIATNGGVIYHCVVLARGDDACHDNDDDARSQGHN